MASAKHTVHKLSQRTRAPVDEHAAHELDLYIENTSELYPQKLAILENLKKKIARQKYDTSLAWKIWMYWVDAGARRYVKEFGSGTIDTIFNKPTREKVAKDLAKEYTPTRIVAGDY
jgi:hypothetical protein